MLVTFAVHHLLPKNHGISSQLMVWRSKRPLLYKPLVMTSISGVHHRKLNLKIGHHRISLPLPARVQALQGRCPRSLGRLTIPGEGLVLYSTKGSDSVDDDFVPSTWVLIFVSGIFGGTPYILGGKMGWEISIYFPDVLQHWGDPILWLS